MTTYRYKSDKAVSEAIYKFFMFGFMASLFGVTVPLGIFLIVTNISNCGYAGYKAAMAMLPLVHVGSWLLISLSMCLVFSMMTRDDPPTLPKETEDKVRSLSFSRGGKKKKMAWFE